MPDKPKILARRMAAESRIFRIEQMDLQFSNGKQRTYERILGGQDSVMIAAMPDTETVLLVREYAAGSDRYEIGLPKGIVERSESPLAAANREIQEETGFGAKDLRIIHRVSLVPGYIQHYTLLILARDLYRQSAEGDEPEPIEVIPWRLDQLDALLERDDFSEARSIAGVYLVNRFLALKPG